MPILVSSCEASNSANFLHLFGDPIVDHSPCIAIKNAPIFLNAVVSILHTQKHSFPVIGHHEIPKEAK